MGIESKKVKAQAVVNTIRKLDTKEKYLSFIMRLTAQIDLSKGECSTNLEKRTIVMIMVQASIRVGNYSAAAASAADEVTEMYQGLFKLIERNDEGELGLLDIILLALEAAEKAEQHKRKHKF